MFLCRISVRYASSGKAVFKPVNFKHTPRFDEITEPFDRDRRKRYDRRRLSDRDEPGGRPGSKERDEEGLEVIRAPLESSYESEGPSRGSDLDRRRGSANYQSDDRGGYDQKERTFDGRGRFNDGWDGYKNQRNFDDETGYTKRGNYDSGKEYRNRRRWEVDQDRQFDDSRMKRYDSRHSNDNFKQARFDDRNDTKKFDFRHDHKENKTEDSHARKHGKIPDSKGRMKKLDPNLLRNSTSKEELGGGERFSQNKEDGSSTLLDDTEKVFGIYPVLFALRTGKRMVHRIVCKQGIEQTNPNIKEIFELAADKNIEFTSVKGSEIKKFFKGDTVHQGIFCLASPLPIDVFNFDEACQQASPSVLMASSTRENSEKCTEEFQHSPLGDPGNEQCQNPNPPLQNSGAASLSPDSPSLSHQMAPESETSSVQSSSHMSLEDEPADVYPTPPTPDTIRDSTEYEVPPNNPQSTASGECITGRTLLSTQALSSAVAIAASHPREDGSVDADPHDESKPSLWLLLDNVTDPMNVGAVLRSCCYFGVTRVLFTPSCAEISPVVSKASSGAAELLPLSLVPQPGLTLANLRGRGWKVLVAVSREAESRHKPRPLHQYEMTGNTILVVGSEGTGISRSISEQADDALTIPATGPLAEALGCLNVSVAAAITLHALTSQH